jgi:two-component system, NtrC family, sensor kinase
MRQRGLKKTILLSFFTIIAVLCLLIAFFGTHLLKKNILDRAQLAVQNDLLTARALYNREIEELHMAFSLVRPDFPPFMLKERLDLDYVVRCSPSDRGAIKSEIVQAVFSEGKSVGGTRIIDKEELMELGYGLYTQKQINIIKTPHARPTDKKILDRALAIECAVPIFDDKQEIVSVLYGGKVLNKDYALVDGIRDLVFENRTYNSKSIGTVTIFFDDVRIATNVLTTNGERAIGTLVSREVYENVVEKGQRWVDRAFVVNDWYLTAYEPIKNIRGDILGILYVGMMEAPYRDLSKRILFIFLAIIVLASSLAIFISFVLANAISRPLWNILDATCQIYGGDFNNTVKTNSPIKELNSLAISFNMMAEKLHEREKSLKVSNEKLAVLNKSYLDLLGFVAHELKGILSSTVLNAYAVRDGFLGMINFKQRKAMDSVVRNLDYLTDTVKNYLNLSRIEKGELEINKHECSLRADVFDAAVEAFLKQAGDREITLKNELDETLKVNADQHLLQIVANNLVGNAIKYGLSGGEVKITAGKNNGQTEVEVYNDGRPLTEEEVGRLFQKFSRLKGPEGKRVQGTGLGLFITKEIIEKHGGAIWVKPQEKGNSFYFTLA